MKTAVELAEKLIQIKRFFDIEKVRKRNIDMRTIARYYKINRLAYFSFHSRQGFVHMGISRDGIYRSDDLLEQTRYIEKYIKKISAKNVLELASGKGANSLYLGGQFPEVQFEGIDLPQGQSVKLEKNNLHLGEGDYHDLSRYPSETFDVVFIIEALCHSPRKEIVVREVKRVLKKEGIFIIIDGYRAKTDDDLTDNEKIAAELTEKGMMVERFELYETFKNTLNREGYRIENEEDVSSYTLPTLERLEKRATRFFNHPLLAKLFIRLLPEEFTANAISGYLLLNLFRAGIFRYTLLTVKI